MSDTVLGGPVGGVWEFREIGRKGPREVMFVGEMMKQDIPEREPPLRTHARGGISEVYGVRRVCEGDGVRWNGKGRAEMFI
jgi:hypothetical protein